MTIPDELVNNLRENFLNKVCTVLTHPASFQFNDAIKHAQFFSGKVADINTYGIWLKHLNIETFAFYTFPIIGIVEEQVIPHDDPRAEKIKEELKQKKAQPPSTSSNFIPVDSLTKMIRDAKK